MLVIKVIEIQHQFQIIIWNDSNWKDFSLNSNNLKKKKKKKKKILSLIKSQSINKSAVCSSWGKKLGKIKKSSYIIKWDQQSKIKLTKMTF